MEVHRRAEIRNPVLEAGCRFLEHPGRKLGLVSSGSRRFDADFDGSGKAGPEFLKTRMGNPGLDFLSDGLLS